MKKTTLASGLVILSIAAFFSLSKSTYAPRQAAFKITESINGAIEYFNKIRSNQITGRLDLADVEKARTQMEAAASMRNQSAINLSWEEMGPDDVGGRTRVFLIDKDTTTVLYAGGVAGGLWKSFNGGANWKVLFDQSDINTVTSITQASNGDIYVGTGEGHYNLYGSNGTGAGGMIGSGIFKSIDRGANWTRLSATVPTVLNSANETFTYVNEVATSPTNPQRVYASTYRGLRVSDNGGQTWYNPIHTGDSSRASGDVKVGSDGTVLVSLDGLAYRSPNGNDNSFVNISTGTGSGKLPTSGVSRIEFAFAPSDPNYVYACMASNAGDLYGLYQSTNNGVTWVNISSALADPLGGQGSYDNCIAVSPTNKNRFLVGGTTLYTVNALTIPATWTRISVQYPGTQDLYRYVHPDLHVLMFDPTNAQTLYVTCDGGIFRTTNLGTAATGGPSFTNLNNGYNVTQFYAIAPTANGGVVGGTQDNGSKYINPSGGTGLNSSVIGGGDGGYTEASFIYPSVFFATVYYGALTRSFNTGSFGSSFYSDRIENLPNIYEGGFASFITPIALYESFNDTLSPDSVNYVIKPTDATSVGGVLQIQSRVTGGVFSPTKRYFNDTNKVQHQVGDTIRVKDILQSRLAVGFNNSIWLTKHAIDESGPVNWMRLGYNLVADPQNRYFGMAKILRFSKDGDYLYVGTFDGNLFRFSNLKSITYDDTLTGEIGNPKCQVQCRKIFNLSGRALCGIAIDPNNNDRVIATFGNYGNSNYVYISNNATAAIPNFASIQGNLPAMPVYDALIDMNNTNSATNILLGTELGVWASNDNGATWSQSSGFPKVPVLCLRQQIFEPSATVSNTGSIYAGTHGRGVWRSDSFVGIKNILSAKDANQNRITVSPNPSSDYATLHFSVEKSTQATLRIYTLQGKLVKELEATNLIQGKNKFKFSVSEFEEGTYIVSILTDSKQSTAKFVVLK